MSLTYAYKIIRVRRRVILDRDNFEPKRNFQYLFAFLGAAHLFEFDQIGNVSLGTV